MSWFQRKRGRSQEASSAEPQDADVLGLEGQDADALGVEGQVEGQEVEGRAAEPQDVDGRDAEAAAGEEAAGASPGRSEAEEIEERRRSEGPHDESEVDSDGPRIDLGAISLPANQGMELRLELEEATKRVIAVTVTIEGSSLQLQAFAAPRRDGLWDDIRGDIAAQVTKQGGTADDVPGVFGREVLARLPVRTPDGRSGHRPSRFVGMDGPRWFLRGVFTGPAAVDEKAASALEDVFRGTVLRRGTEAMAPRDLLPLRLPAGAQVGSGDTQGGGAAQGGGTAQGGDGEGAGADGTAASPRDPLSPFERGPEITERR